MPDTSSRDLQGTEQACCCATWTPRRFQRLSPTWETSNSLVEPIWLFFCGLLCRWKRSCSSCPSFTVQSPTLGHHLRCTAFKSVSKCSPIPFETRQQTCQSSGCLSDIPKWSDFDASPACRVVIVCFFAQSKEFRQLLSSRVHPSCGKRTHVHFFFFCSLDVTPKCVLACASLDTKKCDDPLVSCWQTWILLTPKSSAALAMVPILLARVQSHLTAK